MIEISIIGLAFYTFGIFALGVAVTIVLLRE